MPPHLHNRRETRFHFTPRTANERETALNAATPLYESQTPPTRRCDPNLKSSGPSIGVSALRATGARLIPRALRQLQTFIYIFGHSIIIVNHKIQFSFKMFKNRNNGGSSPRGFPLPPPLDSLVRDCRESLMMMMMMTSFSRNDVHAYLRHQSILPLFSCSSRSASRRRFSAFRSFFSAFRSRFSALRA